MLKLDDPITQGVMTNLIANALTTLVTAGIKKGEQLLVGEELLEKWKIEKTALLPIIQDAIDHVANEINWDSPVRMEILVLFLETPEVEQVVRQIFSLS